MNEPKIYKVERPMIDLFYEEDRQYNIYIDQHRENVCEFYNILHPKLKGEYRIDDYLIYTIDELIRNHDLSKYEPKEFNGYRQYFYPKAISEKSNRAFNLARNHHQKANPHHWEYWVMADGEVLEMPLEYIIEMFCDWGAMSMKFNNKISAWYNDNKTKMKLHEKTESIIERFLTVLDSCLKD